MWALCISCWTAALISASLWTTVAEGHPQVGVPGQVGDIRLGPRTWADYEKAYLKYGAHEDDKGVLNVAVITDNVFKWPHATIPYTLENLAEDGVRAVIDSLQILMSTTCLRFVPRDNQENYIAYRAGQDCSSELGMIGGRQTIDLTPYCYTVGKVIHETMHALGFDHEHTRPDRDEHVIVLIDNVIDFAKNQFEKHNLEEVALLNVTYDYASLLHYDTSDFTKNGAPTIVPIKPHNEDGSEVTFGGHQMSQKDILKIQKFYGCEVDETVTHDTVRLCAGIRNVDDANCEGRAIRGGCSNAFIKGKCPVTCNTRVQEPSDMSVCDRYKRFGSCAQSPLINAICFQTCNTCF